jgi:8-oxo-dGTP pyrophosphatase MutT (NUDIX family)
MKCVVTICAMADLYQSAILRYADKQPSAGMLFYCPEDKTILLTKRSMEMNSPGTWDIPGGRSDEDDESSIDTATREVTEEITHLPKKKKLLGKHALPTPGGGNQYIIYVYAISAEEKKKWTPKIQLDYESEKFKWVPYDKVPKPRHLNLDWVKDFINDLE